MLGNGWVLSHSTRAAAVGSMPVLIHQATSSATTMHLTMVSPTEWHSEFVAYLATKCWRLRKSEVMGICRVSATNEASLLGNRLHMRPIEDAARGRQSRYGLVDHGSSAPAFASTWTTGGWLRFYQRLCSEAREPLLESLLHMLGINLSQAVFRQVTQL
jgi:hypothetical protein